MRMCVYERKQERREGPEKEHHGQDIENEGTEDATLSNNGKGRKGCVDVGLEV